MGLDKSQVEVVQRTADIVVLMIIDRVAAGLREAEADVPNQLQKDVLTSAATRLDAQALLPVVLP